MKTPSIILAMFLIVVATGVVMAVEEWLRYRGKNAKGK